MTIYSHFCSRLRRKKMKWNAGRIPLLYSKNLAIFFKAGARRWSASLVNYRYDTLTPVSFKIPSILHDFSFSLFVFCNFLHSIFLSMNLFKIRTYFQIIRADDVNGHGVSSSAPPRHFSVIFSSLLNSLYRLAR